jgi:hypothetical protein
MSAAVDPRQAPHVSQPKHPLHAMTTFELRAYRRQLQDAISFSDTQDPVPVIRDDLQIRLDAVTTEQESRKRIADARP